jgi:hypothetical protein
MIEVSPETRLLVLGDSHARFWNGQDDCNGADLIEGIQTLKINGALAWSLAHEGSTSRGREIAFETLRRARENGFHGTVMLSFGEIDIRFHILKHAVEHGLEQAVLTVAERYVSFIREVYADWKQVVIWAPPPSRADHRYFHPKTPTIGSQIERNFATIFFIDVLRMLLADTPIQVLSLLPLLLCEDGTTKLDLLYDGAHVSQTLMPSALYELDKASGLRFTAARPILALQDRRIDEFSSISVQRFEFVDWLAIELRQSMFVSHLQLRCAASEARVRCGYELNRFDASNELASNIIDAPGQSTFRIDEFTRCIWISLGNTAPEPALVEVIGRASDLLRGVPGYGCTSASLFHLSSTLIAGRIHAHAYC